MPATKIAAALVLCLVLGPVAAHANIVKLEITKVEPAGPTHERITGKAHGELDPADPKNAVITDIELAPRNARGKVEYVTTFSLVRPTGTMTFSGVLIYTVVNRGGGNALPHPAGHVTLVSGWQGGRGSDADQLHHRGAGRKESRRLEHHRTAAAAVHESHRHIPRGWSFPAASLPRIRLSHSTRRRRRSSRRPVKRQPARKRAR